MTFSILGKQKVQMYGEFLLLIARVFGICAGYYILQSYIWSIILFVIPTIAIDIFFIYYIINELRKIK